METDVFPPVPCEHCSRPQIWPLWRNNGEACYISLCNDCAALQTRTFTPSAAIAEARAIVRRTVVQV